MRAGITYFQLVLNGGEILAPEAWDLQGRKACDTKQRAGIVAPIKTRAGRYAARAERCETPKIIQSHLGP